MNIKHLVAAVAVLASTGAAFAQQIEWVEPTARFVSTVTWPIVTAEVRQARPKVTPPVNNAETSEILKQIIF